MKKIFFRFSCLLLIFILGCGKETTNQKLVALELEGQVYENKGHGFFIKLYPEYKKVSGGKPEEEMEDAVCFAYGKITRFATIFWKRDVIPVHNEYKSAFENPENFLAAKALFIFEELGAVGKIIEVKKLDIKDVDAYYFLTKHKRFLTEFYRTRIEIFPKNRNLQITVFFQNKKEELPKVAKMIESMKIIPGQESVKEDIHTHHH